MTADVSAPGVDLGREADFDIGPLRVRPSAREIELGAKAEMLEPRVMQALVVLATRGGQVVSRDALIETCWDGRIVGDDAINRVMAKIRRLGMSSGAFVLETIPRVGYRLALQEAPAAARGLRRRGLWAAAAVTALVVVAALAWFGMGALAQPLSPTTPVAVAAFTAASSDPAAREFAASVQPYVAGLLAENELPVVEPSARRRHFELQGEVRTEGGLLHTRTRLVESRSGVVLWTREFSAPPGQAEQLRYLIAWRAIFLAISAHDNLVLASPDFDEVSLGYSLQISDQVGQGSWSMVSPSEALHRRSPRYAPGHVSEYLDDMARAAYATPQVAAELRRQAAGELAEIRALTTDPFPNAVEMVGTPAQAWARRDAFLDALEAKHPENFLVSQQRMTFLYFAGRPTDAGVAAARISPSRGPTPGLGANLAGISYSTGHTETAVAMSERYFAMRPTDAYIRPLRLHLAIVTGDYAKARAVLADPAQRPGYGSAGLAAMAAYVDARQSGSTPDRRRAIAALNKAGDTVMPKLAAAAYLSTLGDLDDAFRLANAYIDNPSVAGQFMMFDPHRLFSPDTRAMRADPRFIPLMEKMGLVNYWRSTGKWPDFCETEPLSVCAAMKAAAS